MEESEIEDSRIRSAYFTQPNPPPQFPAPNIVTLSPFTSSVSASPRRLSSCYSKPSQAVRAKRQLAWVSLQGRIIGAEEASSAKTIGGFSSRHEAVAWELFSPIHRILIVAVVAVAAANSKKNKQISRLKKSVEVRDQILLDMQKKVDNLCEQVNNFKDQPEAANYTYGCSLCEQHKHQSTNFYERNMSNGDDVFKYAMPPANQAEPEERRMSDLSDWAPSVNSSVDVQLSTLAFEEDICHLRKECEEKDAAIKELATVLQSSEAFGSKRIRELEDIIRRRNLIIMKLKKDILVLEQKVVNLTRLRRPSFSSARSNAKQLPPLTNNILYDMDNTTGPSSSDSDNSPRNRAQTPAVKRQEIPIKQSENASRENEKLEHVKSLPVLPKPTDRHQKFRSVSPLKEKSMNHTSESVSTLKPKQISSAHGDSKRRRPPKSRDAVPQKRWL